jgi:tetratricopeptide (TPR) repeat protein
MSANDRLDALRRRLQKDPASIVFAQLAEELRRAGQYSESVDVCRAGLAIHPGYLSARVTLGRTLLDLNRLDEAQEELEQVRSVAPENLAAIRALAEIHGRRPRAPYAQDDLEPVPVVQSTGRSVAEPSPAFAGIEAPRLPPASQEPQSMQAAQLLTALEMWLAAIHVARASRSA